MVCSGFAGNQSSWEMGWWLGYPRVGCGEQAVLVGTTCVSPRVGVKTPWFALLAGATERPSSSFGSVQHFLSKSQPP